MIRRCGCNDGLGGGDLLALAGLALIVRRHDMAKAQSLVAGGRLGAGCAVVEGALLLLMALAVVVMNRYGLFD